MGIQDIFRHFLGLHVVSIEDRLKALNEDITEFIVPEIIDGCRYQGEVILFETTVTVVNSNR